MPTPPSTVNAPVLVFVASVGLRILASSPTYKSRPIPTPPATVNAPLLVDTAFAVDVMSVSVVAIVNIPCATFEPILIVAVEPVRPPAPILIVLRNPEFVPPEPMLITLVPVLLLAVKVPPLCEKVP